MTDENENNTRRMKKNMMKNLPRKGRKYIKLLYFFTLRKTKSLCQKTNCIKSEMKNQSLAFSSLEKLKNKTSKLFKQKENIQKKNIVKCAQFYVIFYIVSSLFKINSKKNVIINKN